MQFYGLFKDVRLDLTLQAKQPIVRKLIQASGDNNLIQVERVNYESVIARVINCHREGKPIEVKGISFRYKGICWFLLRPLRWINVKIDNSKKKYHETTR
jgi:hypothetical protein